MKLVICNAGLLTIQEAIWHQKLVLGIPLDVGQQKNIQRAIDLGFAEFIDVNNFTSTEIAIKTRMLIENPIYLSKIESVSSLMRSSPIRAKATAIHWIEAVLKHNGLSYLKSEARKLSFFKLYMLDIAAFAAIIILIYILIMQYHVIKAWVLRGERKRRDKLTSEAEKLKRE